MNERIKRTFSLIERIASHQTNSEENDAWSDVYMLVHVFNEKCKHPDWEHKLEELEKELKHL